MFGSGLFSLFFVGLFLLGFEWWLAAIIGAILGFVVSYIFLRSLRDRVAADLAATRQQSSDADEAVEDGTD